MVIYCRTPQKEKSMRNVFAISSLQLHKQKWSLPHLWYKGKNFISYNQTILKKNVIFTKF